MTSLRLLAESTVLMLEQSQSCARHSTHKPCRSAHLLHALRMLPPRFGVAAGVYTALAQRLSGPGDSAVTLEERMQAYQDALMQVSCLGPGLIINHMPVEMPSHIVCGEGLVLQCLQTGLRLLTCLVTPQHQTLEHTMWLGSSSSSIQLAHVHTLQAVWHQLPQVLLATAVSCACPVHLTGCVLLSALCLP